MAKRQVSQQVTNPQTEEDILDAASGGPRLVRSPEPSRTATEKAAEWKQTAGEKIHDLKQRGAQAVSEARESFSDAYEQAKAVASSKLAEVKETSAEMTHRARIGTRNVLDNYPLHVLAGIAGMAFLAGVLLRIWRSNRYE